MVIGSELSACVQEKSGVCRQILGKHIAIRLLGWYDGKQKYNFPQCVQGERKCKGDSNNETKEKKQMDFGTACVGNAVAAVRPFCSGSKGGGCGCVGNWDCGGTYELRATVPDRQF